MLSRSGTKRSTVCKTAPERDVGSNPTTSTKKCSRCSRSMMPEDFAIARRTPRTYYRRWCKTCENRRKRNYNVAYFGKYRDIVNARIRDQRRSPEHRAKFIVRDSRRSDQKKGLVCDLSIEFVQSLISRGCTYCKGERDRVRMSLDRIDNTQGHTRKNVLPSCIDCNLIRANIPEKAWKLIVPAIRKARRLGLFNGWSKRK